MIFNLCVIIIIILIGLLFSDPKFVRWSDETKRRRYIWIVCFILVLESGLRNVAVGPDTYAYYLSFENIKQTEWNDILINIKSYYFNNVGKDPGYLVFQKFVQFFISDYQVYLFLIATIFFGAMGSFIYKNTHRLSEVVFAFVLYSSLFYSVYTFTAIRQTIAMSAVLVSYEFVKKRKFWFFLIILLVASTIHRSCLIFFPVYFIVKIKRINILYPIVLLSFPVLMIFKAVMLRFFQSIGGYNEYLYYEGAGTATFTIMLIFVSFFLWWRMKYVICRNQNAEKYYNVFVLALFFTPLTWINPNAMRIVMYFSIFMMILVPQAINSFKSNKVLRKLIYNGSIIILLALFINANPKVEYNSFGKK